MACPVLQSYCGSGLLHTSHGIVSASRVQAPQPVSEQLAHSLATGSVVPSHRSFCHPSLQATCVFVFSTVSLASPYEATLTFLFDATGNTSVVVRVRGMVRATA
jgi:hypothetical protein